ncbi:FAD-dependent oxidoreductase [Kineosporia sp. NBRC 101731]|uniref:NAD(P)/FAD-dependent oxidoreductase n=1 Tax=Kineosporia sp. NBRC 101731 TaxID=3032199 RepID=UPI0024A2C4E5|nr:FAD-dependent oxidoreductase [Kineosporia sp. NBRC 101731]GLY30670.1 oxidoreductase [Kineosporia sp. NBRC 101731]
MTDGTGRGEVLDLLVIGGGVMGLFTAYQASRTRSRVAVVEVGEIGDPMTASFGRTRSYRRDYLEAGYTRFADEAIRLWTEFETATGANVLVRCGCMNIASTSITPDLDHTYATLSTTVLRRLGIPVTSYDTAGIAAEYPYLKADLGDLDPVGGLVDLRTVTRTLQQSLQDVGVAVHERTSTTQIAQADPDASADGLVTVTTSAGTFTTRSLVITAGHGTNDVLALLPGNQLHVPITKDRPSEAKYFTPTPQTRHLYTSDRMPVMAYLDTGIYLHPIVEGVIDAVKIGFYNPPDMPRGTTSINSVGDFVEQCMPGLLEAASVPVTDVDGCDYDLVADDDFVLGAVPGFANVFVGVGWRGTGYKYAPWVGRVLAELACQEGTVYDVARFAPSRFVTA